MRFPSLRKLLRGGSGSTASTPPAATSATTPPRRSSTRSALPGLESRPPRTVPVGGTSHAEAAAGPLSADGPVPAAPSPTPAAQWVDKASAGKAFGFRAWSRILDKRPALLARLSTEHGVPEDEWQQCIATVVDARHLEPRRKENDNVDVYSMPFNGKTITVGATLKQGRIADISDTSTLNGMPDAIDGVMSTALGVDTSDLSRILQHPAQWANVPIRPVPGRVMWINWDLLEEAMEAGHNRMNPETRDLILACCHQRRATPELEAALLRQYSFMVDTRSRAERLASRLHASDEGWAPKAGQADRYEHARYRGSGRQFTIPYLGGAFDKGAGRTGLEPDKTGVHSTGLMSVQEAALEAAAGEVMKHILDNRTTRILMIIAPDIPENREQVGKCIAVRVGSHLRPASLVTGGQVNAALREEALSQQYKGLSPQERNQRIIDAHALMAARLNEYRILHGSMDSSNFGLAGNALDFGLIGALRHRGPPLHADGQDRFLARADVRRGTRGRVQEPAENPVDRPESLEESVPAREGHRDPHRMRPARRRGGAPGRWQPGRPGPGQGHPRLGRWFHEDVPAKSAMDYHRASLFDRDLLQSRLPSLFFGPAGEDQAATPAEVERNADPYLEPSGPLATAEEDWRKQTRFQKYAFDWKKKEARARAIREDADAAFATIAEKYPQVMRQVRDEGIKAGRWEDPAAFAEHLRARAEFQNEPLEALYSMNFRRKIAGTVKSDERTAEGIEDRRFFERVGNDIDSTVSLSRRRVDDLMFNSLARFADSERQTLRLQPRTVDGQAHWLEADRDGQRRLIVEIPLSKLSEAQQMQVASLVDGQSSTLLPAPGAKGKPRDARLSVAHSEVLGAPVLRVGIDTRAHEYGTLAGTLTIGDTDLPLGQGAQRYTYAVPDRHEWTVIEKTAHAARA